MKGLKDTLSNLARLRGRFERLLSAAAKRGGSDTPDRAGHPREIKDFGSNPGNLRLRACTPRNMSRAPALVVALHGCTQTAADYDHGSGWSTLADRYGFAVLFPEQQRANNPNNCFNWFLPSDTRRSHGEAFSIRQMIERMIKDHGIDRRRVFVVGLSAGGAMTSAMLATYPDLFAGGAIIAGLPYGCAANVQEAFETMAQGRERSAREWGDMIRSASRHRGPWPKVSLWHGSTDAIVNFRNMEETLKQWIDVHGVSVHPHIEHEIEGHSRRVWRTEAGDLAIEAITVRGMGHGVPLATGSGRERCGNAGPFHFDVGLSSSHHIVRFWGLADNFTDEKAADRSRTYPVSVPIEAHVYDTPLLAARDGASSEKIFSGEDKEKDGESHTRGGTSRDPGGVIAAALNAAGLLSKREPSGHPGDLLDPRRVITATLKTVGLLKK
jgi:poly(hydroxyalkanoate) depolymerase family esterase